jgi:hypothetical protein
VTLNEKKPAAASYRHGKKYLNILRVFLHFAACLKKILLTFPVAILTIG